MGLNFYFINKTALILAAENGNWKIAKELLKIEGIDINIQDKDGIFILMIYGYALLIATQKTYLNFMRPFIINSGYKKIINALIERDDIKLDLKEGDKGNTYLFCINEEDIVHKILKHKEIDFNQKNNVGDSPIHLAVTYYERNFIKGIFNDERVDINIKDKKGFLFF